MSRKDITTTTVADLMELIERTAMSLAEVGETKLSERCHVRVTRDGLVSLSFDPRPPPSTNDVLEKALSLDPKFESALTNPPACRPLEDS